MKGQRPSRQVDGFKALNVVIMGGVELITISNPGA